MLRTTLAIGLGALLAHWLPTLQQTPHGGLTPQERDVLSHMRVVLTPTGDGRAVPTVLFEGVNVQIVNGSGVTDSTNGRGNLIVGYQVGQLERGGSHNVVLGDDHAYTSYGGLVSGEANQLRAPSAVALAARASIVEGPRGGVVCGQDSEVHGADALVLGGSDNRLGSGAVRCVAVGSEFVQIDGSEGDVTVGGQGHTILGGSHNVLLGGASHHLFQVDMAGLVSGLGHELTGSMYAALLGGEHNLVGPSLLHAALVGGFENSVTETHGVVVGGADNSAQGAYSTVTGGLSRSALGDYDWVAGGLFQDD